MEVELLYVSEGSTPASFPPGCPVSGGAAGFSVCGLWAALVPAAPATPPR